MPSQLNAVLFNWAGAVALWALPYLTLRHCVGAETTQALQWLLVAIGVFGTIGALYLAWQMSGDRAWRASHGLLRSHTAN